MDVNYRHKKQCLIDIISETIYMKVIARNVPVVSKDKIMLALKRTVATNPAHSLHKYTDASLKLRAVLIEKMNKMTPAQFEQILHPIFQVNSLFLFFLSFYKIIIISLILSFYTLLLYLFNFVGNIS